MRVCTPLVQCLPSCLEEWMVWGSSCSRQRNSPPAICWTISRRSTPAATNMPRQPAYSGCCMGRISLRNAADNIDHGQTHDEMTSGTGLFSPPGFQIAIACCYADHWDKAFLPGALIRHLPIGVRSFPIEDSSQREISITNKTIVRANKTVPFDLDKSDHIWIFAEEWRLLPRDSCISAGSRPPRCARSRQHPPGG